MTDFSSVPNEISHKDLNSLFLAAVQEANAPMSDSQEDLGDKQRFNELLAEWSTFSKEIIDLIHQKHSSIGKGLDSSQTMALGALEVHLSMSLKAKSAYEKGADS